MTLYKRRIEELLLVSWQSSVTTRAEVVADFQQFYLMDDQRQPPMPEAIAEDDLIQRIRVAPFIVVFQTASAARVPVSIDVVSSAPTDNLAQWDHVAEFSLAVPSGRMVLAGCTEYVPTAVRITAEPGEYRGRVYVGGLTPGAVERYRIVLWPSTVAPSTVLKQYSEHAS
jgi:hypothetical protein